MRGLQQDRTITFGVNEAWDVFQKTRKVDAPANLFSRKVELQRNLEEYVDTVRKNEGKDLTGYELPKDFLTKREFRDYEANGFPVARLDKVADGKWYSSLERMRAKELRGTFDEVLKNVELPNPNAEKLQITDVGSRSNFFFSLMKKTHPEQEWQAVDIKNYDLPAHPEPNGYSTIHPFEKLPKSDIITLNSVLHHVGELEYSHGKFDDKKVRKFIGTVKDALPENGLVIVTEDFIGKDKENPSYKNFVKGVDELFYPKGLGNQKPSAEWIKMFTDKGFVLEKEEYPVHFNVVGFPVVETLLVFRKKTQ